MKRREFVRKSTLGAIGAVASTSLLTSCGNKSEKLNLDAVPVPELYTKAPDGRPLKAGLIGCGNRGCGAALNFVHAGDGLSIVALADAFQDKMDEAREKLAKNGIVVPDENCFVGLDAYKKVIDSDVDVVLLCTPNVFRPEHFAYVVEKGKHCFCEKPAAVDPVGARKMIALSRQADAKGLCCISGTIRRSQRDCIETYRRVAAGAIGEIVSAHVVRYTLQHAYVTRKPGWSDMEYMLRNWYSFTCMNGDFIIEQFIHEIDQMLWFCGGQHPVSAEAVGGCQRHITGDMYDNIAVEYVFENGHRACCMSRQINDCDTSKKILVYGTKGYTDCVGTIYNLDGTVKWQYPYPEKDEKDSPNAIVSGYDEEHMRLVAAIRKGEHLNDLENMIQSNIVAMMGREASYTGKFIKWDEFIASDLNLTPDSFEFGPIEGFSEKPPVMGEER